MKDLHDQRTPSTQEGAPHRGAGQTQRRPQTHPSTDRFPVNRDRVEMPGRSPIGPQRDQRGIRGFNDVDPHFLARDPRAFAADSDTVGQFSPELVSPDQRRQAGPWNLPETDEFSYNIVRDPVHVRDFQAMLMQQSGIDHERFTYKYQGLDQKLTGVEKARVVKGILS